VELLRIHPEVRAALEARRPVVALETTLVAHGFPGGVGAEVAAEAERRVRVAWAVPATVGVIDGRICVGMEEGDLERFASAPEARKVGPRDLAACAVKKELGATTVGATLAVCRAAGIGFMGTGGIGGVHRGFAETLDVSADLGELARTEALVVSSGAKSILDVAATAEVLRRSASRSSAGGRTRSHSSTGREAAHPSRSGSRAPRRPRRWPSFTGAWAATRGSSSRARPTRASTSSL
jgi:pseudouridylate synthase